MAELKTKKELEDLLATIQAKLEEHDTKITTLSPKEEETEEEEIEEEEKEEEDLDEIADFLKL